MIRTAFARAVLIDTSAAIALHDPQDPAHASVRRAFASTGSVTWAVLDITSHECYTKVRYSQGQQPAVEHYVFLRESGFHLLRFDESDETDALQRLRKYSDQRFSFHDALCAAVMLRIGIYRILTLDSDFVTMGFEVIPPK